MAFKSCYITSYPFCLWIILHINVGVSSLVGSSREPVMILFSLRSKTGGDLQMEIRAAPLGCLENMALDLKWKGLLACLDLDRLTPWVTSTAEQPQASLQDRRLPTWRAGQRTCTQGQGCWDREPGAQPALLRCSFQTRWLQKSFWPHKSEGRVGREFWSVPLAELPPCGFEAWWKHTQPVNTTFQ